MEVLKKLLARGIDKDIANEDGYAGFVNDKPTALYIATYHGHGDCVKLLLQSSRMVAGFSLRSD